MDKVQGQKISFDDFFTKGQFQIQEERLAVAHSKKELTIGLPNDSRLTETRVPLVPNSIRSLIGCGYNDIVETGAGIKSKFADHDFAESGPEIKYNRKEFLSAHFVIKILLYLFVLFCYCYSLLF